jgi:hypothetical protein
MAFHPPKGVRPPQFEGKRTGRPKGSRTMTKALDDILWGFDHAKVEDAVPPTAGAALWQAFAEEYFDEVYYFLDSHGII